MKIGKVSEAVLKRSVLNQIHTRREEVLLGASVGEDCAAVAVADADMTDNEKYVAYTRALKHLALIRN